MDLNFTEEQSALSDTLQRFGQKDYSFEQRQKRLKDNQRYNEQTWQTFAEFGILALPFSEEDGGLNGNSVDTHVAISALAPALVLEPLISTSVLAASLIQQADQSDLRAQLIEAIASGQSRFAFAHYEPQLRYNTQDLQTQASQKDGKIVLNGHKAHVADAPVATHLLVSAKNESGQLGVYLVKQDAQGVKLTDYPCHDNTTAAEVSLENVEVESNAALISPAEAAIEWALALTINAQVAEAASLAKVMTQHTIEYLKTRKQFGVPLSNFQALQHRLAEMMTAATQAESMALLCAINLQDREQADLALVHGAKAHVFKLAKQIGQEAIQMHGGVGVTDELAVSHLFKRVINQSMRYGDVNYHIAQYSHSLLTSGK
ncbi:acyl-CoA dehydrogenase family protein [Brackiella oedipodis]|uniref:acyl-CoA dehydrogenase family protein n=1 Tax=Brackiella oedipodis TaxID=124225 RepID=UPI00048C3704|nr:acyl-CoA dehydrogenase family protein [Brackiella oedipodis]